jgi:hypothetical protein
MCGWSRRWLASNVANQAHRAGFSFAYRSRAKYSERGATRPNLEGLSTGRREHSTSDRWKFILALVVNRPPFVSRIPDAHRHKATIEEACQRVLSDLGSAWSLSVTVPSDRDSLEFCLVWRQREGSRTRNRNWIARPHQQDSATIEKWILSVAAELKKDAAVQFGMTPADRLSPEAQGILLDIVIQLGGRMNPEDGWITLADDRKWRALEERVLAELDTRLVASVR